MASNESIDLVTLQWLTDCTSFVNGLNCEYGHSCRFRHCRTAIHQKNSCFKWPHSCANVDCRYRHPPVSFNVSRSVQEPYSPSSYFPHPKAEIQSSESIISIFWDLENIPIPRTQKPFDIVQRIRRTLIITPGLQEVGFTCYCDVNSISQANQLSLMHANVRISHVPDRNPNGVDRQILLDLDRFERTYRPPATVVLISGDIDFVGKLADLRYRAHFKVIVIHNKAAKQELKAAVNEHYSWDLFTSSHQYPSLVDAHSNRQFSSAPGAPSSEVSNYDYGSISSSKTPSWAQYSTSRVISLLKCPQCSSQFEAETSLQQHQVAKQHLFDCSLCNEQFYTSTDLMQHQKNTRHRETKQYTCAECHKSFCTLKSLEQHENATGHGYASSSPPENTDRKPLEFYCSKCNIQFSSAGFYVTHMLVHIFD
jgi:hypothetical protein